MATQTRTLLQPTLWLAYGDAVLQSELIQPERKWLRAPANHVIGGILAIIHHISTGSELVFEGSKNGEAFTEIARISGATFDSTRKFVPIALSTDYPLSDVTHHMWPLVRWRWTPPSGGTLANQSVCFEAQVVTKS